MTDKEKQIEEMANQIYRNFGLSMPTARNIAKYLINKKGYRKASEVAEEIFAEIEKYNHPPLPECEPIYIIKSSELAELKNKYTEEK